MNFSGEMLVVLKSIHLNRHNIIIIFPEQFTVKAHSALFEGDGKGWAKKWGTVIPVYSWHTLSKWAAQNIIPVYSDIHFQNALKTQKFEG